MNKFSTAEKYLNNPDSKKKQDAKKSLNNYVNQLKLHFDLNDEEIVRVLEAVLRSKKKNIILKKWWQIWK